MGATNVVMSAAGKRGPLEGRRSQDFEKWTSLASSLSRQVRHAKRGRRRDALVTVEKSGMTGLGVVEKVAYIPQARLRCGKKLAIDGAE
jgi:hypothetical protein